MQQVKYRRGVCAQRKTSNRGIRDEEAVRKVFGVSRSSIWVSSGASKSRYIDVSLIHTSCHSSSCPTFSKHTDIRIEEGEECG